MHTPFVLQLLVTALNYMSVPDKNRGIITSASLNDMDPALYSFHAQDVSPTTTTLLKGNVLARTDSQC